MTSLIHGSMLSPVFAFSYVPHIANRLASIITENYTPIHICRIDLTLPDRRCLGDGQGVEYGRKKHFLTTRFVNSYGEYTASTKSSRFCTVRTVFLGY